MRKRIAVYANGWNVTQLREMLKGMKTYAAGKDTDVYAFINYSTRPDNQNANIGETNIYRMPIVDKMDGVVFLANSFNTARELDSIYSEVVKYGIPAVSVEYDLAELPRIETDNYAGMYKLVEHMICEHGMKDMFFITGPNDHADNLKRMKAVKDACDKHGVHYGEDNVVEGDWMDSTAKRLFGEYYDKTQKLPDAVICSNDIMALGVCTWMEEHGFIVPEDCAVVGYDCINQGQEAHPILTTVKQNYEGIGRKCVEILLDKINGKEVQMMTSLDSEVQYGESCGCELSESAEETIANSKRTVGMRLETMNTDQHFRNMYNSVRKTEDMEGLHSSLNYFFHGDNWMEGKNFIVCLEPKFFHGDELDVGDMTNLSNRMEVVLQVIDGEPQDMWSGTHSDIMFNMSRRNSEPHLYLVVALHSDEKAMGYVVLDRSEEILNDFILYIWTRHMNQYMEQVRQNMLVKELTEKLTALTVTDSLTGVYNRAGCERIGYPALERFQAEGRQSAMMIADVDRMKTINDYFGHAQGDRALRIVAKTLKASLPEGWIISRYGGDEFFMAGICEDYTLDELVKRITDRLDHEKELEDIPFHLTLSVGGVILARGESFDLLKCLQKADNYMYEMKKKRHEEMDGQ